MNAFRLRLTAAALAVATTFAGLVPAQAVQMPARPAGVSATGDITNVQMLRTDRGWRDRSGWYRGHRGYRERRPGYRYHNGFWFPLAAFGAGALIGGAIQADRGYGSRHVAWCESRYRTYRAFDNTYVASAGIRRSCVSPYR